MVTYSSNVTVHEVMVLRQLFTASLHRWALATAVSNVYLMSMIYIFFESDTSDKQHVLQATEDFQVVSMN
jgi:hypothetical protein